MNIDHDRIRTVTTPRRTPTMSATIARRALINYRLDPGVVQPLLPDGLRPQLVDGSAVAGVCLIRLSALRPAAIRPAIGHSSRSAAHRIAVEWDDAAGRRTGVYIPRRHSSSRLARAAGGRVFPGTYAPATISIRDTSDGIDARIDADDLHARVVGRSGPSVPFRSELFATLEESSAFFRKDPVGWSPSRSGTLEGMRLETNSWSVQPLEVSDLTSSFFDALPRDAVTFDHALLMSDLPAQWTSPSDPSPVA